MGDYAEPLLTMKQMLKDYEQTLIDRKWEEVVGMAPILITQLRLLTHVVQLQAEKEASL